jgi:hypothetical protein
LDLVLVQIPVAVHHRRLAEAQPEAMAQAAAKAADEFEAAEADMVLSSVVRCLSERAKSRPLLQLVLVGSADKFELVSALRPRYGSNAGLARARADWVAKEITRRWPDPPAPVSQALALTVGPGQVGENLSPAQTGDDRGVAIHAVWGKERTTKRENAGSQPDVECAATS